MEFVVLTVDEVKMSACDHLLCRHVALVTRRRQLAAASKTRIRTLVRTAGAGSLWKGAGAKRSMVN
jgi:hypothetical protein